MPTCGIAETFLERARNGVWGVARPPSMKIGVVGCGAVGATVTYALVMSGVGREIVLSQIIAGEGATFYGIGSAVDRIVDLLLQDQRAILTLN